MITFTFTSIDWAAHQSIINHKCLIYTADYWMHFSVPGWPKEEYFAQVICGAREIMEKVPAMRENESLPTLWDSEHHEGTSLLNGQLGPGSRKIDEGWWKKGIVWFLLHSLTQLTNRPTDKNLMFPASIPSLCKGGCRCSRKWGRRKGTRKWSQYVHPYT